MSFVVSMKQSFMPDFLRLNRDMQSRFGSAMKELEHTPDEPRGDTIKRLKYHDKLWRYRVADYRMVYAVYREQNLVQLVAVGPRGEIYERLDYQPDLPNYGDYSKAFEMALDPNQETPAEWAQYVARQNAKQQSQDTSRTLPYRLGADQLAQWNVPPQYRESFKDCETENDLMKVDVPDEILLHVLECLWPKNAGGIVQSPNLLVQNPDDLARYAQGDLMAFLLLLDNDQSKMVDFSLNGPTLVKGGPGSGKSTVALYRVRTLVRQALKEKKTARILFTTYTNALIGASNQLIERLLKDEDHNLRGRGIEVDVKTLDQIAMQIASDGNERPSMAQNGDVKYSLTHARTSFQPEGANALENGMIRQALRSLRDDYLLEEFEWVIEGRGLSTVEEYLNIDRSGRGYAFDARMRRAVWQLYQHSREFIHTMRKITWGEMRAQALEKVLEGKWQEKWDYVLVDEAQDLTPMALSLAIELCVSPKGLFLTADACQSLYNKGFAWKNVHDSLHVTGRTRILKRNYRTTRQITEAASSLMRKSGAGDDEALSQIYVHVGPRPKVYAAKEESDLFMWLAHEIQAAARELSMPVGAAAVLAPTNELARQAAYHLCLYGLPTEYMSGREINLQTSHTKALTIHSAKGLEFPIIAIPYLEEGFLPRTLPDERADDLQKHLQQELRLLFVGSTRAMRRLLIAYRDGARSRFLREIDSTLWEMHSFDHVENTKWPKSF